MMYIWAFRRENYFEFYLCLEQSREYTNNINKVTDYLFFKDFEICFNEFTH